MRKAKEDISIEAFKPEHSKLPCKLRFKPPLVDIDDCIENCLFKCSHFYTMSYVNFYCEGPCSSEDMCPECKERARKARIYTHMKLTLTDKDKKEKLYEKYCEKGS